MEPAPDDIPPFAFEPSRPTTGLDFATALESAPRLSPEEAASFADDIEAARNEMNRHPMPDPWGE